LAAGNHPGPNELWLEAVALGFRVAVRPSRREPFTPHRLVLALRAAGLTAAVVLLPTDHDAADELVACADLSLVYGGDDVVAKYAGDAHVLTQAPGRSKSLITEGTDWPRNLDLPVDSIAPHAAVHTGRRGCADGRGRAALPLRVGGPVAAGGRAGAAAEHPDPDRTHRRRRAARRPGRRAVDQQGLPGQPPDGVDRAGRATRRL